MNSDKPITQRNYSEPSSIIMVTLILFLGMRNFNLSFFPIEFHYVSKFFMYLLGMAFVPYLFIKNYGLILPLKIINISILLSFFSSYYSWGQDFFLSFLGLSNYLSFFVFFYLLQLKIEIKKIEQIMMIFAVIYLVLFYIMFFFPSIELFASEGTVTEQFGINRVLVPGIGPFIFATYYSLVKFTEQRNIQSGLFLLIATLTIILLASRQVIIAHFIILFIHFGLWGKIKKKILILLIAALSVIVIYANYDFLILGLFEKTLSNLEAQDNYIRIRAGRYFLFEFTPDLVARILGNGIPTRNSDFWVQIEILKSWGFYLYDFGLLSLYFMFGIGSIVGYIIIFVKGFLLKIPHEYIYLKYYLLFILILSLASYSLYHYTYLPTNVLVFFILHKLEINLYYNISLKNN